MRFLNNKICLDTRLDFYIILTIAGSNPRDKVSFQLKLFFSIFARRNKTPVTKKLTGPVQYIFATFLTG
jgi:hypothetical protein